ncbi:MAG TPA: tRNA (adenosine(37)-N6)-threonylcarbamoyltransferase complex dimerization subunit type 1 TsaB [Nitrolancea sp.]|nr:tRNA (adenosine(37)-N6)-threonylcarbamoyltransferase complex dimerization subunit type 1 TsaB [Nitrolancea sp.]
MPNHGRIILAIDSSTEQSGVALYDGETFSELSWDAGRNQTSTLSVEINHLMTLARAELRDLGAIAVAIGPGSFNGLRVGLSVAKGLCFGLGIPICGVGTLDIAAYPHAASRSPIRAFVRAGRGRAVYADYRHRNGRWVRATELRNEPFEAVASQISERTILVGDMPAELAAKLADESHAVLPSPALRLRRPSYLAEIGYRRWQAGDTDPIETLEPIYVHGAAPSESRSADAASVVRNHG